MSTNSSQSNIQKLTLENIIAYVASMYGDKYSFEKAVYTSHFNKIIVTCRFHGDFQQNWKGLQRGRGCPECAFEHRRYSRQVEVSDNS